MQNKQVIKISVGIALVAVLLTTLYISGTWIIQVFMTMHGGS
jgi:hypothetical protein